MSAMASRWPQATLGNVARLRVLAAAVPGAVVREQLIEAPFDAVWAVAGDLEGGVPRFEPLVARARIHWRHGERLTLVTHSPLLGMPSRFDVELRPGWCLMQETRRRYLVGMAADPEGERTRFAHLEGVPRGWGRLLVPLVRAAIGHDVRGIERLARERVGR